jgi:hypothetical protein
MFAVTVYFCRSRNYYFSNPFCDFAIFLDEVSSELICQSPIMGDTFDPSLCFRHSFTKLA